MSPSQERAAVAGSALGRVSRIEYEALADRLAALRPDVVLLAARGPLVRVLARLVAGLSPRPVIVSGLPGISIPATKKALVYRAQCDLFVLHSRREVREFAALARLRGERAEVRAHASSVRRRATGCLTGPARDRSRVRGAGDRPARARGSPPGRPTARAGRGGRSVAPGGREAPRRGGEHQTHVEADALPDLLASLGPLPPNLVTSTGPMAKALDHAQGLVTVSSTAAIEAVARGIPVIALDVFGVADELINPVFRGSGLFGGEEDVVARRLRHPSSSWLHDNYFHDPVDDDLPMLLEELVLRRRESRLRPKPPLARRGGRLREAWERKLVLGRLDRTPSGFVAMAVGMPVRAVVRAGQRLRRRVLGAAEQTLAA